MDMPGESFAFKLTVIIVSFIIGIIVAVNIYYFNKVRQNPTTGVTSTAATWMIVLNSIILIILLVIIIWAIVKLIPYQTVKVVPTTVVTPPVTTIVEQPRIGTTTVYPLRPTIVYKS
jgi:quinol-cytochrome oxidoreductase complex cytochrome b subunit